MKNTDDAPLRRTFRARVSAAAPWLLAFGLAFAPAMRAAEPAIEFVGVLGAGGELRIALAKTGSPAEWVTIGREFAGYTVKSFEAKTDEVVLTRGAEQLRLRLKNAKVKQGVAAEPPPEMKRALLNNLRQLAAAADQYYLENGKTTTTLDELVGETKYVKRLVAIDGEDYRQLVFAQGKPLTVTTASGYTLSYAP